MIEQWTYNYDNYKNGDRFESMDDFYILPIHFIKLSHNVEQVRLVTWRDCVWWAEPEPNSDNTLRLYGVKSKKFIAYAKIKQCTPVYKVMENKEAVIQ